MYAASGIQLLCRIKQLTPNYIKIRINGNNTRAQKNHLQRSWIPEAAYMYNLHH
jgi:hypothetical protein